MGGAVPGSGIMQAVTGQSPILSALQSVMSSSSGEPNTAGPMAGGDVPLQPDSLPQLAALPPVNTGGADPNVYRNAIKSIESAGSGDYSAVGPNHPQLGRALGAYQIMEANIGPWSQEALGRPISVEQFMASPALQDRIFDHKFGQYVQKFGPEGAAQAWFAGEGGVGKTDRKDVLGTSVGEYGQRFNKAVGGPQYGTRPVGTPNDPAAYQQSMASRMFGGEMQPGEGETLQKQLAGSIGETAGGGGGGRGVAAAQASETSSGGPAYDDSAEYLQQAAADTKARQQGTGQRAAERKAALRQRVGARA